ncbi:GTP-binding protein Rheb homolog 1-like [Haliotis asinina]|uniref:GTP-binding protein Rheb homolog 1-like n=1 Tax=Haliotis asinina TaxID=109174 RepID=UPI003531C14A
MFIVVYALDDLQSFNMVFNFCRMIKTCSKKVSLPILIAANKLDNVEKRIITSEMALGMARKLKCPHIEVSARWNLNVTSMFDMILSLKVAMKKENTVQPSSEVPRSRFNCFSGERKVPSRGKFPIQRSNTFHGFSDTSIARTKANAMRMRSFHVKPSGD